MHVCVWINDTARLGPVPPFYSLPPTRFPGRGRLASFAQIEPPTVPVPKKQITMHGPIGTRTHVKNAFSFSFMAVLNASSDKEVFLTLGSNWNLT